MKKWWIFPLIIIIAYMGYRVGRSIYFKPNVNETDIAPDFRMQDRTGAMFQLSDLKGKYVYLHFWGSWCGPCRKTSKDVVNLYQSLQSTQFTDANGLEIVTVGVDSETESFMNAAIKDGFNWPHFMTESQMFEGPVVKLYGIRSIPYAMLLGPDRKIILLDCNAAEASAYLSQKINKN